MVSPSGTGERRLESQRAGDETRLREEWRERVGGWRHAVDLFDEHAPGRVAARSGAGEQDTGDCACGTGALRLPVRQPCGELTIAASKIRGQRAVDENHR